MIGLHCSTFIEEKWKEIFPVSRSNMKHWDIQDPEQDRDFQMFLIFADFGSA